MQINCFIECRTPSINHLAVGQSELPQPQIHTRSKEKSMPICRQRRPLTRLQECGHMPICQPTGHIHVLQGQDHRRSEVQLLLHFLQAAPHLRDAQVVKMPLHFLNSAVCRESSPCQACAPGDAQERQGAQNQVHIPRKAWESTGLVANYTSRSRLSGGAL